MGSPRVTVSADRSLVAAARLLDRHRIRRLPVLDDAGRLVAVTPGVTATSASAHVAAGSGTSTTAGSVTPSAAAGTAGAGGTTMTGHGDERITA